MTQTVTLHIVVVAPPPEVDFGLQLGSGNDYQTVQTQRAKGNDLTFSAEVQVKNNRADGSPNFLGSFTQGPPNGRFIYIDIGTSAGQTNTPWERRIKVPLAGISWDMINKIAEDGSLILEARLPGTGRDGGPSCATVHPVQGWQLRSRK